MHSLIYTVLFAGLAQAPTAQLTAQLEKTVLYREPAISPDGKWVAWAQTAAGENRPQVHLQRVDEKTAAVVRTAAGPRRDSSPAFSPDSKNLAFFSTAGEKDQAQLWTLALGNSSP